MKPTHLVTYPAEGFKYEFHVSGATHWWRSVGQKGWVGPNTGFSSYLNTTDWIVKKLNTFKGNK